MILILYLIVLILATRYLYSDERKFDFFPSLLFLWIVTTIMISGIPTMVHSSGADAVDSYPVYTEQNIFYTDGAGMVMYKNQETDLNYTTIRVEDIIPYESHQRDLATSEILQIYQRVDTGYMWIPIDIEYDNKEDIRSKLLLAEGDTIMFNREIFKEFK